MPVCHKTFALIDGHNRHITPRELCIGIKFDSREREVSGKQGVLFCVRAFFAHI
jgi:hypothetical protein